MNSPDLRVMTAAQMREHSNKTFEDLRGGLEKQGDLGGVHMSVLAHIMQALWEIAAQLEEFNRRQREQS